MNFSHLDKLYWRKEKISKGDLLQYYTQIAPYILPYLKNRAVVLHRFPDGIEKEHFYQKESGPNLPSFIKTTPIQHENRKINYFIAQNVKSLLYIVNLGSIELHPFHAKIDNFDHPDYMVLDLDPQNVSFNTVVDVARKIHELLEELHIPNLCKTSGGKGLHIYIPLHGKYSWEEVKKSAYSLAKLCHEKIPNIISLERVPQKRRGKIYIDYLQNHEMKSVVAPYSVRGKPGAPVSTPLLWKEVVHGIDPSQFTIKTVPKRLAQKGDVFKEVLRKRANLKEILLSCKSK